MSQKVYQLQANKLGCIVKGIDLSKSISKETIGQIVQDVTQHRLLIFKNQGVLAAEKQLEISKWFGTIGQVYHQLLLHLKWSLDGVGM